MKRLLIAFSLFMIFSTPIVLKEILRTKKTLYVYMWSDYIKTDLIKQFEKEYSCSVIIDTYDSNEAMYTKLMLGGGGYDIIFPSNYFLSLMKDKDLLSEINEEKISHYADIDWAFLNRFSIKKERYGIPYMVSFSGIAYRKDRVETPNSWSIFENRNFRRRMTMLNDPRETLGAALLFLGYSANSQKKEEIFEARDCILSWKKQLAKLESEQYKNGLASAEYLVAHAYNGDTMQLIDDIPTIGFAFPKEGTLLSIDYAAILKDSTHKALAHAFIDFLHRPEIAAKNMVFTKFRSLNRSAIELLPEKLRSSPTFFPEHDPKNTFECLHPVGQARTFYIQAWDSIKSS